MLWITTAHTQYERLEVVLLAACCDPVVLREPNAQSEIGILIRSLLVLVPSYLAGVSLKASAKATPHGLMMPTTHTHAWTNVHQMMTVQRQLRR